MERFQTPDDLVGRCIAEALACQDVLAPVVPSLGRATRCGRWLRSITRRAGAAPLRLIRPAATRAWRLLRPANGRADGAY
jgi:hypothetical protein